MAKKATHKKAKPQKLCIHCKTRPRPSRPGSSVWCFECTKCAHQRAERLQRDGEFDKPWPIRAIYAGAREVVLAATEGLD